MQKVGFIMKNTLILLVCCILLSSCTVTLGESTNPPKQTNKEVVEDLCKNGNKEACEIIDQIQKKKDEKNQNIIKESGIRDR